MSSLFIALATLILIPISLSYSYVGLYGWFWISFMNPHRLVYGPATDLPFAAIFAGVTILSFLFGKDKKSIPLNAITILIMAIALWITLSSVFALVPDWSWYYWDRYIKIMLMTLVAIPILNTVVRIQGVVWVSVLSIGYFGVTGGIFTILTAGAHRVYGPPGSFIADNNHLALALLMTVPFLRYLQLQTESRLVRNVLLASMVLLTFSIIGSQSRGAFLGIIAMSLFLIAKSRHKIGLGLLVIVLATVAAFFVPERWVSRMETIENYEEDESAQSRLLSWRFHYEIAKRKPIVGGGFGLYYDAELYKSIVPEARKVHNAHSIYFQVLGQQGFGGLALYLALLYFIWRQWGKVARLAKDSPELSWAVDLAAMAQVSQIAFMVSGAFLNLAYFDFFFLMAALSVATEQVVNKALATGDAAGSAVLSDSEPANGTRGRPPFGRPRGRPAQLLRRR
ncbi:MAG: putative O-glycosylation ligase, exosortase A system-associated [Rhodothalassiaceae bacterium]